MAENTGSPYPSTSVFRDPYKQKEYRDQSQSQYKDDKEASHIVSLRIAMAALNENRPPGRPPAEERNDVKDLLNNPSNLRMVKRETNREDHERLDMAIIAKSESGDPLTVAEEQRAKLQVSVIQENKDILELVTYGCFKTFYQKLRTQSGRVVWDARHD